MPKTAKNLWNKIVAWDNLVSAAKAASKNKLYNTEALHFNTNLEENLLTIQQRLTSGEWLPGPFHEFDIYHPKFRHIQAPIFRDRVVHHALIQQIGQYFEKRFIDQSFACRVGKGTHAASNCLMAYLRSSKTIFNDVFVLKGDISKYFYSINHKILQNIISKTIGDKQVLEILYKIITENSYIKEDKGLPSGALTSQLFANAYLDKFDHFIKNEFRIKYYVRYMDDFIIIKDNKYDLNNILKKISDFLKYELELSLNHKTNIFPANLGIDFVGYRHWHDHILPRKANIKRTIQSFRRLAYLYKMGKIDLKYIQHRLASFCGMMKHCDSYHITENVIAQFWSRIDAHPKSYME